MLKKEKSALVGTIVTLIIGSLFFFITKWSIDYYDTLDDFFGGLNRSGIIGIPSILICFLSFCIFVVYANKLIHILFYKKNMKRVQNSNQSFSRLYYQPLPDKRLKSIHEVIHRIDGKKPIKGFDQYGDFVYIPDKAVTSEDWIETPTDILIRKDYLYIEYNLYGKIQEMDFIFLYPNEKYLMFFNEYNVSFILQHRWDGSSQDIVKYLEEYNKLLDKYNDEISN